MFARLRTIDHDLLGAFVLAIGLRLVFVVVTQRVWEDALITVQHAQNAASGLGLTHHAGEGPTHGFTSALSVLIPLAGEFVAAGHGLTAMRIASLVATIATLAFAARISTHLGLSRQARLLVLLFLAVEQNHVFYGMAGMETQVTVAILLAAIWFALRGSWVEVGITMGLALLARPDFILLLPFLGWARSSVYGLSSAVRSTVVGSLVIAPWVLFTLVYYGSPVPQTILAKSATYAVLSNDSGALAWGIGQVATHVEPTLRAFMPFLADSMVAQAPIPPILPALVAGCLVVLILFGAVAVTHDRRWWPLLGFLSISMVYRVFLLPSSYYDWYVPPITAVAILIAARGLDRIQSRPRSRHAIAAVLVAAFLLPWPWFLVMEREVQRVADDGVRSQVASYLGAHVEARESVVSESAGYVGRSGVLLWDYPGLTSPTALGFVQEVPREQRSVASLVAVARPDWAVLRPSELGVLRLIWPQPANIYEVCASIGPGGEAIAVGGLVKRSFDLRYHIIRRHPCPG